MVLRIPYGGSNISVDLPSGVSVDHATRSTVLNRDADSVLTEAIEHPFGKAALADFLKGVRSVLIVINDATRPTPTGPMLDAIARHLNAVPQRTVIVATGLHRRPSEDEYRRMLGPNYHFWREFTVAHDGFRADNLAAIKSPVGMVALNRAVLESDRVIVLTSVEPHFFAGFSGGRKSLIPGLSDFTTVERSHAGAVQSVAAPLIVENNPVRNFINSATQAVDNDKLWAMQVVLDKNDSVVAAFAGDIDKTFAAACTMTRNHYTFDVERLYDIALSRMAGPLSGNLYQAQKGWEHAIAGVRDSGVVIVMNPCTEGIGPSYYQRLIDANPDVDSWPNLESTPYKLGLHKLVRIGRARKRIRIMAVTTLEPDDITRYGYEGFADLKDALDAAVAHVGTPARMIVIEDGGLTTLIPVEQQLQS